jgi:hypothetical protein
MNPSRYFVGLGLLLLMSGCTTVTTHSDWDTAAKFSNLKTFAWVAEAQPKTGDFRLDNSILDTRIRAAIDRELTRKGYQKLLNGEPNFYVRYQASIQGKLEVTQAATPYYATPYGGGYGGGYGAGWATWGGGTQTFVDQYDEGTLVVDFADPKTKKLIWRGTASAAVDASLPPVKREKRINDGVAKLLKKFPPQ